MADNPSYYKIYQNNAYLFTFTVQEQVLADERTKKYLEGKQVMKVIVVKGRIVNIVAK